MWFYTFGLCNSSTNLEESILTLFLYLLSRSFFPENFESLEMIIFFKFEYNKQMQNT